MARSGRWAIPASAGIQIYIDPTLVRLGAFQITWHGFFTAVGTVVGIWLAVRLAKKAGFTEDDTVSVAMWGVVGAIVGARLFHVVDQWDYYARDPLAIIRINEGGIAIYGAIVGGVLAGAIYGWRRGLNVPRLADVASLPLILGMAIGRVGDVINGEHRGIPAEGFPLAVTYAHPDTLGEIGVPVHLAVGYELLLDLAIFALLLWLVRGVTRGRDGKLAWSWQPRYPRDGMVFWTYLGTYAVGRFFVQFYRVDTPFALGFSQAQLLSVVAAMAAVWMLVYQLSRAGRSAPGRGDGLVQAASSRTRRAKRMRASRP